MSLELKKLELAIQKAKTAKMELDLKICERQEDILRMEDHKELQDKRIANLENEIEKITSKEGE